MTYSVRLPRGFIAACLGSVYILGFIITPYWLLHKTMTENMMYLILTMSVGLLWLFLSTGSLQVEFSSRDVKLFLLLLVFAAILNLRALNSVLPFRGDEVLHVERTLELVKRLPILPGSAFVVLLIAFLLSGVKKQSWALAIGILVMTSAIAYFLASDFLRDLQKFPAFFVRYPFINYWFFAIAPKLASPISTPYHEALYRIIPLLAMVGTAWIVQKKSAIASPAGSISLGLATATIPVVFYYSSILYLEPPAVFLMTAACLDITNLLSSDNKAISQLPSWYALLLIGFVKETTIPFLFCFIIVRILTQLQIWSKGDFKARSGQTLLKLLAGELGIAFSLLAPAILYLFFRSLFDTSRTYAPHIANLFDLSIYPVIIRSFVEQFGLFFFLFIGGCVVLLRSREFPSLFYYVLAIIAILVFHIMDDKSYVGYSRFNLFILPPILAGSVGFTNWAFRQRQYVVWLIIFAAAGVNLLLSPVHLDGVKTPRWGNYLADTAEHYYPYQDALIWLKENHGRERILFTGLDFYYPFQFYWNKLDWKPRKDGIPSEDLPNTELAISNLLERAENERYSVVVYRVADEDPVLPQDIGNFRTQVIKNSAHTLLIFYKP